MRLVHGTYAPPRPASPIDVYRCYLCGTTIDGKLHEHKLFTMLESLLFDWMLLFYSFAVNSEAHTIQLI